MIFPLEMVEGSPSWVLHAEMDWTPDQIAAERVALSASGYLTADNAEGGAWSDALGATLATRALDRYLLRSR